MKPRAAILALLLAGCLSQPHAPEPALYDLGLAPQASARQAAQRAVLAAVNVTSPSWLDNTAMHYRLLYDDPMRTRTYAYAGWIAPPPEMFAQRLQQTLAARGVAAPPGGLEVRLEEYVQVFETPTQSEARVAVHVRTTGGREVRFTEQIAAPTADAAGGAKAIASATDRLIARIVEWLAAGDDGQATAQP
jgi:ABC-type uncharacterized transport system auxiliary subunit